MEISAVFYLEMVSLKKKKKSQMSKRFFKHLNECKTNSDQTPSGWIKQNMQRNSEPMQSKA